VYGDSFVTECNAYRAHNVSVTEWWTQRRHKIAFLSISTLPVDRNTRSVWVLQRRNNKL
jgi:hypothetical protein